MKRLFKFKYPKMALLAVCVIAAYFIFSNDLVKEYVAALNSLSYFGALIGGFFFSFGFTTPFAIGLFFDLRPDNIFIAAAIGGFGAMIADMFIFSVIRFSFMDEFQRLKHTAAVKSVKRMIDRHTSHKIRNYLLYFTAGFIIASPLPDELGVTMLAGLSHIRPQTLAIISFIFNSLGILAILALGGAIS